jgi:hypothetical protein
MTTRDRGRPFAIARGSHVAFVCGLARRLCHDAPGICSVVVRTLWGWLASGPGRLRPDPGRLALESARHPSRHRPRSAPDRPELRALPTGYGGDGLTWGFTCTEFRLACSVRTRGAPGAERVTGPPSYRDDHDPVGTWRAPASIRYTCSGIRYTCSGIRYTCSGGLRGSAASRRAGPWAQSSSI